MRKICFLLALLLVAAGEPVYFTRVHSTRGTPGSAEFGFGAVLEMNGPYLDDSLALAADLPLDWIAVTLPWRDYTASPGTGPNWQRLDRVMRQAEQAHLAVMLSLTEAPAAALTPDGPDPAKTSALLVILGQRYPALQAVELFPAANTHTGWGKKPDPSAYLHLYREVETALAAARLKILLVAAGLKPLDAPSSSQEMSDFRFLEALLEAARKDPLPVISMDLSDLSGDPLTLPETTPSALRRYEQIRQIMVARSHQKSLIWVTAFHPPSGTIMSPGQQRSTSLNNQTNWLFQAYTQLRSQLYLGVVFYKSVNPAQAALDRSGSLIINEQEYHPFYQVLRELIAQNSPDSANSQKGRPKDGALHKKQP